jgi:hypothetical protein
MWANAMSPYMKNWELWACPSGTDFLVNPSGPETEAQLGKTRFSYAMSAYLNAYVAGGITLPAQTVSFHELPKGLRKRKYFSSFPLPQQLTTDPVPYTWTKQANYAVVFTMDINRTWWDHARGYNNVYADGHAKFTTTPGINSMWLRTLNGNGTPDFSNGGVNFEAWAVGGFWFRPLGLEDKTF